MNEIYEVKVFRSDCFLNSESWGTNEESARERVGVVRVSVAKDTKVSDRRHESQKSSEISMLESHAAFRVKK
jgi:hypothetical protein